MSTAWSKQIVARRQQDDVAVQIAQYYTDSGLELSRPTVLAEKHDRAVSEQEAVDSVRWLMDVDFILILEIHYGSDRTICRHMSFRNQANREYKEAIKQSLVNIRQADWVKMLNVSLKRLHNVAPLDRDGIRRFLPSVPRASAWPGMGVAGMLNQSKWDDNLSGSLVYFAGWNSDVSCRGPNLNTTALEINYLLNHCLTSSHSRFC